MHTAFSRVDHRPWPVPARRWNLRQSWCDLLFAHWPVPASMLRPLVPAGLEIQEFDSTSWIGVVPFRMEGVMFRPLPDLPWVSAFPEINLRIYVERDGMPGVWFLSLDATNSLAVWAARKLFHLPYFKADISLSRHAHRTHYQSERVGGPGAVGFRASYGPISPAYEAVEGSLEHWLTERYCLYAESPTGTLYRCEVHHHPWPLQHGEAEIEQNGLFSPHGLTLEGAPAVLHFSKRIDVVMWAPEVVAT